MQITEVSFLGVRSAVVTLRHRTEPLRFVLFPMLHIGRADFYTAVADRLRRCHLIVAEGYDGPSSTGRAYSVALRLTRQRGLGPLVHQDIDYAALGVPVVWPEGVFRDTRRRDRMPLLVWLDLVYLVPYLTVTMAVGGTRWLLRRQFEISDDTEVRMSREFLTRWMVEERDRELVEALTEIHRTRAAEPIDVAVVYGAGHMPAVVHALAGTLGYRPRRGGEWLTVIDF
ncbi:hypothetical protein OHA72_59560 [Dactylosporangium sp. NBC_01737]|uniref:hypothetical protein n=1 Tax=Dactylosporangium sp. NBC_01737 TaxID=2975959 RepID=UPI002E13D2AA|nr:hypothetical protein OHA72_59560 [Dactylosporangium sp. NBC_01737]